MIEVSKDMASDSQGFGAFFMVRSRRRNRSSLALLVRRANQRNCMGRVNDSPSRSGLLASCPGLTCEDPAATGIIVVDHIVVLYSMRFDRHVRQYCLFVSL
jgi:hypothetical protein